MLSASNGTNLSRPIQMKTMAMDRRIRCTPAWSARLIGVRMRLNRDMVGSQKVGALILGRAARRGHAPTTLSFACPTQIGGAASWLLRQACALVLPVRNYFEPFSSITLEIRPNSPYYEPFGSI